MYELPSIELLESGHVFPGPYMFKLIGRTDNGFVGRAVAAVRDALSAEVDPPYTVRETTGGRYVSVTVETEVQTAEDVLAVYRRVHRLVGLVVLW
jgi:putative lipoic acid-binding regulatory protein